MINTFFRDAEQRQLLFIFGRMGQSSYSSTQEILGLL